MAQKKVVRRTATVEVVDTKKVEPRTIYQVWIWTTAWGWVQEPGPNSMRNYADKKQALDDAKGHVIARLVTFTLT